MTAKEDAEELLCALLPVAETMLRRYGEFYPYGGYMNREGVIVHVSAAEPDTDHPRSRDLIYILRSSFQKMARDGECEAVAVIFQVDATSPDSGKRTKAIQVCIEHAGGYSVEVLLPYKLLEGEIIYGDSFAQERAREIFVDQ